MTTNLTEKLIKIEKSYLPIIKILETNESYKDLYKGFITFQSKINLNPNILFLGINPGDGAYKEQNNKKNIDRIVFPKRLLEKTNLDNSLNLDWFKKGNARGENLEKKWVAYEWFEKSEKINNKFPARMIDLLYSYTEKVLIDKKYQKSELNDILQNEIQNEIIYSNIYPIATESTKELKQILSLLSNEKNISELIGTNEKVTPTIIQNFFRQRIIDSIQLINPKIIVLLGHSAYQSLTLLNDYKETKIFKSKVKLRKNDEKKYKIISFSRQGNWSPLIDLITTAMVEHSMSEN